MLILEQANAIVESTLKERFALAKEGCVIEAKYSDLLIFAVFCDFWLTKAVLGLQ